MRVLDVEEVGSEAGGSGLLNIDRGLASTESEAAR